MINLKFVPDSLKSLKCGDRNRSLCLSQSVRHVTSIRRKPGRTVTRPVLIDPISLRGLESSVTRFGKILPLW